MNVFKNTKIFNKIVIIFLFILIFNVLYPITVKAASWEEIKKDLGAIPVRLIYFGEYGLFRWINNVFCDKEHQDQGVIYVSPETIIKGKFVLMEPNIFKDITAGDTDEYYDDGAMTDKDSGKEFGSSTLSGRKELRTTLSGWYYALRNLAVVALLSILVYVGIRMLLTSVSQDKAKYKVMFKDWLIALCLLFAMHYIMIAILNISSDITDAIGKSGNSFNMTEDSMKIITEVLNDGTEDKNQDGKQDYTVEFDNGKEYSLSDAFAECIVLGVILVYTIIFATKYLVRTIKVAFLTLLAPISCITYPIDKISDGKAQAYNAWFQEFLYTVIIQPFHLLIYVVLVGSAVTLAESNILYRIMCFAIMIPAEKFIKQMFGFKDKMSSPLAAAAGGAAASHLMHKLLNKGTKEGGSGTQEKTGNESTPNNLPPRTTDRDALVDGNTGNSEDSEQGSNLPESSDTQLNSGENTDTSEENTPIGSGENTDTSEENTPIGSRENTDTSGDEEEATAELSKKDKMKEFAKDKWNKVNNSKAMAIHNRRVSKKYGTTSRSKRWARRAGRGAKAIAKGTGLGLATAAATTVALTTGNVKEAVGILGGAGAYAGSKLYKGGKKTIKGVWSAGKDYNQGLSNDKRKERKAFKEYDSNKAKQEKSVDSFRKNHDGRDPGYKELQTEMKDRFTLSRYGLTDEQIDDALPIYQDMKDELLKNGKTEEDAERIAATKTKESNRINKGLKAKDYRDPKTMQQTLNGLSKRLQEKTRCNKEIADKYARQYIINAGRMAGLDKSEVALPPEKQKVTIPSANNLYGKLQFTNDKEGQGQQEQVQAIQDVLVEIGFDDNKIKQVMEYSSGNTNEEIITSFAQNVKYIVSNDIKENNNIEVGEIKSGRFKQHIVKNETVIKENVEKLDLSKKTGVTDKSQLEKMRALEVKEGTTKFREEGGKMIRGEYSKNDKNNLSEKALKMAEGYKRATTTPNSNTKKR